MPASPLHLEFHGIKLSQQQCIALARPHPPIWLTFHDCEFEDGGTSFVDTLEKRKSSLNLLTFQQSIPFHQDNLKRLLQVDTILTLALPCLTDELALLPFSTKAHSLEYKISASALQADLESLNIVTHDHCITIESPGSRNFPTEPVLSFFRGIANLGHFMKLTVRFNILSGDRFVPCCVIQEITHAVLANRYLMNFTFTHDKNAHWDINQGLDCLKLSMSRDDWSFLYSLRKFKSWNRNIEVIDEEGQRYSYPAIDALYSLNRFYTGSADLLTEPPSDRASLVATVLLKKASMDFQRSALLLSNHVDILNELIQCSRFETISPSHSVPGNHMKRRRRIQQPRAAKRAFRSMSYKQ